MVMKSQQVLKIVNAFHGQLENRLLSGRDHGGVISEPISATDSVGNCPQAFCHACL